MWNYADLRMGNASKRIPSNNSLEKIIIKRYNLMYHNNFINVISLSDFDDEHDEHATN
jgi:hypothetical protein